ncbi:phytanoyl-CoA dioxygenase family protein [Streptomyces sp. M19]
MRLTAGQIQEYRERGLLRLDSLFSPRSWAGARARAGGSGVRHPAAGAGSLQRTGPCHARSASERPFFREFVRLPRLLHLARHVLGGDVYVHQFKINAKAAMRGEVWEWHQDSYFWQREDGMPDPLALNIVIHLDEANEFNGPLFLIPGSHHAGEVPTERGPADEPQDGAGPAAEAPASDWRATVAARLKYRLDPPRCASWPSATASSRSRPPRIRPAVPPGRRARLLGQPLAVRPAAADPVVQPLFQPPARRAHPAPSSSPAGSSPARTARGGRPALLRNPGSALVGVDGVADERRARRGPGLVVEDVYPLTPLQSGMLFHTLRADHAGPYVEQFVFDLVGEPSARHLSRAWNEVVARHPRCAPASCGRASTSPTRWSPRRRPCR